MPLDSSASVRIRAGEAIPDARRVQDGGHMGDWLCLATEIGQDALAQLDARKQGFQTFRPLIRVRQPRTDKRPARNVLEPAFPGYLFALVAHGQRWGDLCRVKGVAGVLHRVGDRNSPAVVPHALMSAMLRTASQLGVLEDRSAPDLLPAIKPGTPVTVTEGAFASFSGIAQRSTQERVMILLDVFGRTTPVEMRRDHVREAG